MPSKKQSSSNKNPFLVVNTSTSRKLMGGRESALMYLQFLILLIVSCLLFCCIGAIAETNTLNQSDTLNSTQSLISNNKNFTLGFIKPFANNNNTYLAIWNSKYSSASSPVWIANRDTPITHGSATLFIDSTGKFVINRTHGDPIQLCPGETTSSNTNKSAVLQDDGNLVLSEVNPNGSARRTLWQSFDCPTDTLLPGMKLGVNHRTGRNWSLTSWLASDDPSPGDFTLEWDPNDLELVVRRRGVVFWTSGILTNGGISADAEKYFGSMFENMDVLRNFYEVTYTRTSDEEFFNYSVNLKARKFHANIEWRINYIGTLSFEDQGSAMLLQDICYGYTSDEGCAKWPQPTCRSYNTTFELLSDQFQRFGHYNESMGEADCRVSCWNDSKFCNCQAYRKEGTVGCETLTQDIEFQQDPSGNSPQYYVIRRPSNGKFAN